MIRRITLKNYMSHTHTVIEPAEGLTVLIGPNNCGKSAVVSALETLCQNESGDYMVRHDEKETLVVVETDDEHSFTWKRKGRVVSYIIDGREVHRVGRGVPGDLQELLRLPEVVAGENGLPFDVHFGNQKSPIFLLDESENRIALFFASSSDASVLLEIQKRHREKVRERKSDEKRLRAELEKLDRRLHSLDPLESIAEATESAESEYRDMIELSDRVHSLETELGTLSSTTAGHDKLSSETRQVASLVKPPHYADTLSIAFLVNRLAEAERFVQSDKHRCRELAVLESTPNVAEVSNLQALTDSLLAAEQRLAWRRDRLKALSFIPSTPVLIDLERLDSKRQQLKIAIKGYEKLLALSKSLFELRRPIEICETEPLLQRLSTVGSAQRRLEKMAMRVRPLVELAPLPDLVDTQPLRLHIRRWEEGLAKVDSVRLELENTREQAQAEESFLREVRTAISPAVPPPIRADGYRRRLLSTAAGVGAVILLLLVLQQWRDRLMRNPLVPSGRTDSDVPPSIAAVELPNRLTDKNAGGMKNDAAHSSSSDLDRDSPPAAAVNDAQTPATNVEKKLAREIDSSLNRQLAGPKIPSSKKNDSASTDTTVQADPREKRLRIDRLRKQLADADAAVTKGDYLNAVLGYGQASLLYSRELKAVENPAKVRSKFMEALRLYQSQVEKALRNADEAPGEP